MTRSATDHDRRQRLGITTVRLTGGEPLLRKNLELLVADIAALSPVPESP